MHQKWTFSVNPSYSWLMAAKTPLTFSPQLGPIDLFSVDTKPREPTSGPINLFDNKPYKRIQAKADESVAFGESVQRSYSVVVPQGGVEAVPRSRIFAPPIKDSETFEFDWPSDEIRRACESFFVKDQEWKLPALNWIPAEPTGLEDDTMRID